MDKALRRIMLDTAACWEHAWLNPCKAFILSQHELGELQEYVLPMPVQSFVNPLSSKRPRSIYDRVEPDSLHTQRELVPPRWRQGAWYTTQENKWR